MDGVLVDLGSAPGRVAGVLGLEGVEGRGAQSVSGVNWIDGSSPRPPQKPSGEHEFSFTRRDFETVRALAQRHAGISLGELKANMVYSRLGRRLRALGIHSFAQYLTHLQEDEAEVPRFLNALTTHLTSFFREAHHFRYLEGVVVPELVKANAQKRRIRVWSAGCSTGEEAYSIAMTLREGIPDGHSWDARILATDLDTDVLEHARRGIYQGERIQAIPERLKRRWLRRGQGSQAGLFRIAPQLENMVSFKRLNLIGDWPLRGPMHVIFCRNVVIYFDKETQRRLFDRFADLLVDDGYLFVGHSETLYKVTDRFELIGNTIYRRRM